MNVTRRIVQPLIRRALEEDLGSARLGLGKRRAGDDITTRSLVPRERHIHAQVIAKASGIVAGTQVACRVFKTVDQRIRCAIKRREGQAVRRGQVILTIQGSAQGILAAERTALNFLSHLSGVATLTSEFVHGVRPYRVKIMDTRKTLPGLRLLEKYAVRVGGGYNHRVGLDDAVLIKTNHLKMLAYGNRRSSLVARETLINEAIKQAKRTQRRKFIEIEVMNFSEFSAAFKAQPNAILLDNWSLADIRQAVRMRNESRATGHGSPSLEVSGSVTLQNVRQIAMTGVDRISIGRLTHSAPALDVSLVVD